MGIIQGQWWCPRWGRPTSCSGSLRDGSPYHSFSPDHFNYLLVMWYLGIWRLVSPWWGCERSAPPSKSLFFHQEYCQQQPLGGSRHVKPSQFPLRAWASPDDVPLLWRRNEALFPLTTRCSFCGLEITEWEQEAAPPTAPHRPASAALCADVPSVHNIWKNKMEKCVKM